MSPLKQRADRIAQAKHRGTRRSVKTELENTLLLLAWESADLSEGQVSSMLNVDRITLRKMRTDAINEGLRLADLLDRGRQLQHMLEAAERKARRQCADSRTASAETSGSDQQATR